MNRHPKKTVLAWLLTLALLLSLLPTAALAADTVTSGTCGSKLTWTLDEDGILTISGTGAMTDYTNTNAKRAPWYSSYRTAIKTVVIEAGVTSIGDYAFNACTDLTGVTLADSVTSIGDFAFYGCTSLTDISVPSGGVTSIGDSAFYNCTSLTEITLPDVTSIGSNAFFNCTALTGVTLGSDVTTIGSYAFYGCVALTSVSLNCDVPDYAFYNCTALTSVTLGSGVTSIGASAFRSCVTLTNITIPDGVTSVGNYAFYGCIALTSVSLNCDVPDYAFYNCTALTSVTLGSGVTSIGASAFRGCVALTNIAIPDGVTSVGNYAFYGCSGLIVVSFGSGLNSIGNYAFGSCGSVKYIYYAGTQTLWDALAKNSGNTAITGNTVTIYYESAAHVHAYGEPVFTVAEDGESVIATFTCDMGDDVQTVDGTVENSALLSQATCTVDGEMEYTAACIFQEQNYTYTFNKAIPATGHSYEARFTWGNNYTECTAQLVCATCENVADTQTCLISSKTGTAATCTEEGQKSYTATCTLSGETYTDTQTIVLTASGHIYSQPVFTWAEDCSACTAAATCTVCKEVEETDCAVTVSVTEAECAVDGQVSYTASCDIGGQIYSDERTVTISAIGHTYGDPVFTWASDYSSATAAFTCSVCGETETVDCAVTTSVQEAKCTSDGAIVYIGTAEFDGEPYTDLRVVSLRTLGHDYTSAITLQPTRYTTGVRTYTCTRCGDVYTEEISVRTDAAFLFDDVQNESSYYYQAVYWGYDLGVTTGTSATLFSPSKGCTRAQFVTFLYRMAAATGEDTSVSDADSTAFTDVSSSASYYNAVLWAAEIGVTNGTSSTTFSPSRTITRREAVAMLYRYECAVNGEPTDSAYNLFYDVKTNDYAYAAILWAIGRGITTGTSSTTFSPGDTCTRGMMISFLYRYTTSGT